MRGAVRLDAPEPLYEAAATLTPPRARAVYLDPCPLLHDAVAQMLARLEIDLVTSTTSPTAALELLRLHRPELFLLEVALPETARPEGRDCLRRACEGDPETVVVVLTSLPADEVEKFAHRLGANLVIHKSASPASVEEAIATALERKRCGEPPASVLTRREREILALVSEGRTNAEVARLLWLSPETVKFHLAHVFRKLGVHARSEASRWARVHDVSPPPAASQLFAGARGLPPWSRPPWRPFTGQRRGAGPTRRGRLAPGQPRAERGRRP